MYNEVYTSCPKCKATIEAQIPQIVLGFGGFNLDAPSTLEKLTEEELRKLKQIIPTTKFYCDSCQWEFSYQDKKLIEAGEPTPKQRLINDICG